MDRLDFAASYEIEGNVLSGVVHVFGTRSQSIQHGAYHTFSPQAFDRSIKEGTPIAFYAHDRAKPLGRPALEVRDGKLHYTLELGHQSYANDLRENIAAGTMSAMSFGVHHDKYKDFTDRDGSRVRHHLRSDLFDISPVSLPDFEGTSALLHSRGMESRDSQLIRARARAWRNK
jgi:HK97 family phage prohead protease